MDASVLLASEDLDDEHHSAARSLLGGTEPVATLDLALYEVANVAISAWQDPVAARRVLARVEAVAQDGGLARADSDLIAAAAALAERERISVYDAAYVAGARQLAAELVSCDVRDLVSRGLARVPGDALGPGARPG